MARRIIGIVVLVALCVVGYFYYKHYKEQQQLAGGDFTCQGCMTPEQQKLYDKEDHGETADGQSEHKIRTARQEDAAGLPEARAAAGETQPDGASFSSNGAPLKGQAPMVPTAPIQASPAPGSFAMSTQPTTAPYPTSAQTMATPVGMPVSDSQSANAPNGMRFGGSGTYQWYRQGDLTWRIDTTNGRSCIIYATLEEWRKNIVYSHGCGRDA